MGASQSQAKLENTQESYNTVFEEAHTAYNALRERKIEGTSRNIFDFLDNFVETKRYYTLYVILYEHLPSAYIMYCMTNLGVPPFDTKNYQHIRSEPHKVALDTNTIISEVYRLKAYALIYNALLQEFDTITKQLVHYDNIVASPIKKIGGKKKHTKITNG